MKKTLMLMGAMLLGGSLWMYGADPALTLSGGSGSEDDPWLISNKGDVLELAAACNKPASGTLWNTAGHYNGKYFKITADIDMTMADGEAFFGIASADTTLSSSNSCKFGGIIDGQNHVIRNMRIMGVKFDPNKNGEPMAQGAKKSRNNVGFIGCLARGGALRNLVFDASCHVEGYMEAGMAVGYAESATKDGNCVIENIINYGTVDAYSNDAGGILGFSNGGGYTGTGDAAVVYRNEIRNCYNQGAVRANNQYVGGIIGKGDFMTIENCANTGSVTSNWFSAGTVGSSSGQFAGGIAGYSCYSHLTNVFNAGAVTATRANAAGIVARCSTANNGRSGEVVSAVNVGPVTCPEKVKQVGSIGGYCNLENETQAVTFINCYYDKQMGQVTGAQWLPEVAGISGLTTAEMTAGTSLSGLSQAYWTYTAGSYPVLKSFADMQMVKDCAKLYINFAAGESADNFLTRATVPAGVTFSDAEPAQYVLNQTGSELSVAQGVESLVSGSVKISAGEASHTIALLTVPKLFEGEGTEESPYLIKTKKDVLNMAALANSNETLEHFEGKYFRQTADIDMTLDDGETFIGIAALAADSYPYETRYFSGTYDGGGFSIKNLDMTCVAFKDGKAATVTNGSQRCVGFFGIIDNATVKNLNIDSSCTIRGFEYVGGIAGYCTKNVLIDNCSSAANIICYNGYAGGILGYGNAANKDAMVTIKVTNCIHTGSVVNDYQYAGGIVGYAKCVIENCANYGLVASRHIEGGTHTTATQHNQAGGIAGYSYGNVTNSVNGGRVEGYNTVAGIIAYASDSYGQGNIISCLSYGDVIAEDVTGYRTGAFYGYTGSKNTLTDCYYDAQLSTVAAFGAKEDPATGVKALKTADFTNGTALEGISAENFTYADKFYPVPKHFATNAAAKFYAGAYILMQQEGSTVNDYKGTSVISTALPYTVTLGEANAGFAINDGVLSTLNVRKVTRNSVDFAYEGRTRSIPLMIVPNVLPGAGTAEDPFIIASPEDMNLISDYILDTHKTLDGNFFKITADLDYTNDTIRPIGTKDYKFGGIVDGQNHVISNITIPERAKDEQKNKEAIFGYVGATGKISNIRIEDCEIHSYGYTSFLISELEGAVENIEIDASCDLFSEKGATSTLDGQYAGGVVAYAYPGASIRNCKNAGNVTGMYHVGGIVGYGGAYNKAPITVENVENSGDITTKADGQQTGPSGKNAKEHFVGGIAGQMAGTLHKAVNTGNVTATLDYTKAMGGIAGGFQGAAKGYASVADSLVNKGNVSHGYGHIGGIFGQAYKTDIKADSIVVKNALNYGDVDGSNSGGLGGIIGNANLEVIVMNCGNYGSVINTSGNSYEVGGIVGRVEKSACQILDCFNAGYTEASGYVAGIVGNCYDKTVITRCFNVGEIKGTTSTSTATWYGGAGIANGYMDLSDCYNTGNVTADYWSGGIAGFVVKNPATKISDISNTYSTGSVAVNDPATRSGQVGNVIGTEEAPVTMSNNYYTALTPTTLDVAYADKGVTHVDFSQLMGLTALGEAFVFNNNCLPMLKSLANVDVAKVNAVYYKLYEGDAEDDVTEYIELGQLEGVTWSSDSECFSIADGMALPVKIGDGNLIATCGDYSKSYHFTISATTGLSIMEADKEKAVYFNLQGVKIDRPAPGTVCIRVIGKKAQKVLVK